MGKKKRTIERYSNESDCTKANSPMANITKVEDILLKKVLTSTLKTTSVEGSMDKTCTSFVMLKYPFWETSTAYWERRECEIRIRNMITWFSSRQG